MKVIRKQLSETEGAPPNIRWNDDCDCFQTFDPFGQTWYDNPAADPRTSIVYLLPPRGGSDPKCDAAENMVAHLEEILEQFFIFAETVQLINSIVGVIAVFQPTPVLWIALIAALIDAIIEIGVSAILFAFSNDQVWEDIKCILYNHLEDDGSITSAQLSASQSEIIAAYPGVVSGVTELMFLFLGDVGMSNAGAAGDEVGDCEDCIGCDPATCTVFDFDISDQGFVTHTWSGGDFQGGVYWTSGGGFPDGWLAQTQGGFNKIGLESHCDCIRADTVKVTTFGAAGGNAQLSIRISKHSDNTQLALKNFYINPTGAGSAVSESTWDIGGFVNEEDVDIEIGVKTTAGYGFMVTKLELIET